MSHKKTASKSFTVQTPHIFVISSRDNGHFPPASSQATVKTVLFLTMADPLPPASLKDDQAEEESPQETNETPETGGGRKKSKKSKKIIASGQKGAEFEEDLPPDTRVCTYQDFSHIKAPEQPNATIRRNPPSKEATFPMKLYSIISNPDFWEISWLPHGRSWRINNPKSFEERVIPIFFRHGRYTSFARQVNGWGFRRITHGNDFNSYYHELFLRGMPHLCEKMRRLTSKDSGARKKAETEKTPDFEAISKEHPLPELPMLPPAMPNAAAPRGMDNYLARLSEAGGVDAYLSSLTDAEVSFLARRQMFRPEMMGGGPPNPMMRDPRMAAGMHPGVFGPMGGPPMGRNMPGSDMKGDPRALAMPGGKPPGNPNVASMPTSSNDGKPPAAASMPKDGPSQLVPLQDGANPNAQQAGNPGASGDGPPGNPNVDQYLQRASESELSRILVMQDAGATQQQQMPPFGGGGGMGRPGDM